MIRETENLDVFHGFLIGLLIVAPFWVALFALAVKL